jgi:hypothetical protein
MSTCPKLPSDCPQDAPRDSKKPWEYSKSARESKSLSSEDLKYKLRLCIILQKEGRLNPALSVLCFLCGDVQPSPLLPQIV